MDQAAGSKSAAVSVPTKGLASSLFASTNALAKPLRPAITATAGAARVTLSLVGDPPSNGGSTITGYNVYAIDGSVNATLVQAGVSLPYSVTGLTAGQAYSYAVSSTNAQGEGVKSATITATPNAAGTTPAASVSKAYVSPVRAGSEPTDGYLDIIVEAKPASASGRYDLFKKCASSNSGSGNSSYQFYLDNGYFNCKGGTRLLRILRRTFKIPASAMAHGRIFAFA